MYQIFIHSSVYGHLGCLHFLGIENSECCSEYWGAYIILKYGFLWMYAQEWDCRIIGEVYFQFFREPAYCFP